MKRTALLTFELSESSSIKSYADEALSILQDEGMPALTCVPWGQAALEAPEEFLGQSPLPIAPTPSQSEPFAQGFFSDPWLT